MNRYQAVLFDLDGTLLDTLDDLADAVNHTLAAHQYPRRTRGEVCRFVGNGVRNLMALALPQGTDTPCFEEILADFRTYYAANSRNKTAPYPGVIALLTALRSAGVRVGVVSNKFDAAVKVLCQDYFGDLVEVAIGERLGIAKKPAPDAVLDAIRMLDVSVDECVLVGDSETDVATAANAGIPCISVLWGFRDRACLMEAGATTFADNTDALVALL